MHEAPERKSQWVDDPATVPDAAGREFRLTRYFSAAALVAFLVVAVALYLLERQESIFFRDVQETQRDFVGQMQEEFARQQESMARRDLLAVHEAAHVNLTRLMANTLWASYIAPFVSKVERISIDTCRALAKDAGAGGESVPSKAVDACYLGVRERIMALPEFSRLDARLRQIMRNSTMFKVKVFDLRGVTVYSSEHGQVGDDKRDNQGWRTAVQGRPASELTHRGRFSAFEGVVENRDLISSYVPAVAPARNGIVGVLEIYSDVTPLLERINAASARTARLAADNQARLVLTAAENQKEVDQSSGVLLSFVGALLVLLYFALLLLVRRAQGIIDAQVRALTKAIMREARWHREKMAALAAMSAGMSHEIGNPLAAVVAIAEDIADRQRRGEPLDGKPEQILEQACRIAAKTRQMADFAAARSDVREPVDTNQMVQAVCDFLGFDRRFRSISIEFLPGDGLPAPVIIPDHLTEALMNLLESCAPDSEEGQVAPRRIVVETDLRGANVVIRITRDDPETTRHLAGWTTDPRIESARRRVVGMGGRLATSSGVMEIALAPSKSESAAS